jgi:ferredoxin
MASDTCAAPVVLSRADVDSLFVALRARGFTILGPVRRDEAIQYDEIETAADLPAGWTDTQAAGRYRLERTGAPVLFGYTAGAASWKRALLPPVRTLWRIRRTPAGAVLEPQADAPPRLALVGVRACELAAMHIQDRVLRDGAHPDATYTARRAGLFIVAVNCSRAGGTCFCASMGAGPRCGEGFDLALTELTSGGSHRFLVEAGSESGGELLAGLPVRPAPESDRAEAAAITAATAASMGRQLDTTGLASALRARADDPRWAAVADRCLACGNCTLACPTCFCTTVSDGESLDGSAAWRTRHWDTCFSPDFSYIHGGSVRSSIRARYRQWLTHKLATWHEQFGTPGCVGCGRCITWCPAGIDLTEEARALAGPRAEETPCRPSNRS